MELKFESESTPSPELKSSGGVDAKSDSYFESESMPPPYNSSDGASTTPRATDSASASGTFNSDKSPPETPTSTDAPQSPSPKAKAEAPANFVSITRVFEPIRGEFVIDPSLRVPEGLRDQSAGAGENNLSLRAHNAEIDVNVVLVDGRGGAVKAEGGCSQGDGGGEAKAKRDILRAKVCVSSDIGDVCVRMHTNAISESTVPTTPISPSSSSTLHSATGSRCRNSVPFTLSITSGWPGVVFLSIPRTFTGPLRIFSKGGLFLSDEVSSSPALRMISERPVGLSTERKFFLGDVDSWRDSRDLGGDEGDGSGGKAAKAAVGEEGEGEEEENDEVNIEARGGRVYLWFDYEQFEKPVVGFWERTFGL